MNNRIGHVSVIIPAYNTENSLNQCLESVFSQTFLPREVIVINDGSEDDTAKIAHEYGDRIVYLYQENSGQGAARNTGLTVATGDYIAFLDADDYWKPDFLKRCVEFLDKYPDAVAVNTGLITRMHDGREVVQPELLTRSDAPREAFIIEDFFSFWAQNDHVRTGSAVIRKNVIDQAGGQRADLRVSQDLEYWGYIATFGKWGYIPEPLWVGNSRAAARAPGWLRRYQVRRQLCPTVEGWQERILPKLTSRDVLYFKIVRGRVAAGYAQNHILVKNFTKARHIVQTFTEDLPHNRLTRLLTAGDRSGGLGWWLACQVVRAREYAKSMMLHLRY